MNEINEIKLPEGVDRIAVKQYDDKIMIEFIPKKRKFKAGDKVKFKDGISSKTHGNAIPNFTELMDKYIGKELTVKEYSNVGSVLFNENYFEYYFAEDWLEPWSEELKEGDLAIFWDDDKIYAAIRLYGWKYYEYHCDNSGSHWKHAIKFESKEQFEKLLRGEI